MNACDDHLMIDLQEFFNEILAGTTLAPASPDEPPPICKTCTCKDVTCMANTRDVAYDNNTLSLMNRCHDHYRSDLQEFFNEILAGTTPVPRASDKPLTSCIAVWNGQTWLIQSRHDEPRSRDQDMSPDACTWR